MNRDPESPIVIADGAWQHVRQVHAYHRRYPEVRGEGRSRRVALAQLANQFVRALDSAPGPAHRAAIERALHEVRILGRQAGRRRPSSDRFAAALIERPTGHRLQTE